MGCCVKSQSHTPTKIQANKRVFWFKDDVDMNKQVFIHIQAYNNDVKENK